MVGASSLLIIATFWRISRTLQELAQRGLRFSASPVMFTLWLRQFSTLSLPHQNIMKLFTEKFIQTLLLNVVTIAAIVVGIVQFCVRSYKENNGNEKVRKVMQIVLQFVDNIVEQGKVYFADPVVDSVPVAQVSRKSAKRIKP